MGVKNGMQPLYGMIHGRFQPFHVGHLDYMKKAMARCQRLIVGITNPDPFEVEEEADSSHRHLKDANPYTFFQRLSMVKALLIEENVDLRTVTLIPFSVHHPEKWPYYLPPAHSVVHYMRIFSDWEQTKADRLRANGFAVEILDEGVPKSLSGIDVRGEMERGNGWKRLVPPAVAQVIEEINQGKL